MGLSGVFVFIPADVLAGLREDGEQNYDGHKDLCAAVGLYSILSLCAGSRSGAHVLPFRTHAEAAEAAGLGRERFAKLARALERAGLLDVHRTHLRLIRLAGGPVDQSRPAAGQAVSVGKTDRDNDSSSFCLPVVHASDGKSGRGRAPRETSGAGNSGGGDGESGWVDYARSGPAPFIPGRPDQEVIALMEGSDPALVRRAIGWVRRQARRCWQAVATFLLRWRDNLITDEVQAERDHQDRRRRIRRGEYLIGPEEYTQMAVAAAGAGIGLERFLVETETETTGHYDLDFTIVARRALARRVWDDGPAVQVNTATVAEGPAKGSLDYRAGRPWSGPEAPRQGRTAGRNQGRDRAADLSVPMAQLTAAEGMRRRSLISMGSMSAAVAAPVGEPLVSKWVPTKRR